MKKTSKNSNMSRELTIEQVKEDCKYLLQDATEKKLCFKAKGLNLCLSVFEIKDKWETGSYLFPANYWELINPNQYLKEYSKKLYNAQLNYDYAHKRFQVYVQKLDETTNNKTN